MPTDAEIQSAIDELARIERQDWIPKPPLPVGSLDDGTKSPAALLEECGTAIVPRLVAALPAATGTGRIALASLIRWLDRDRGEAVIYDLCSDPTPAWVDTCVVGYRSVADWARSSSSRWAKEQPPRPKPSTLWRRRWLLRAIVVLVLLGVGWLLHHAR